MKPFVHPTEPDAAAKLTAHRRAWLPSFAGRVVPHAGGFVIDWSHVETREGR